MRRPPSPTWCWAATTETVEQEVERVMELLAGTRADLDASAEAASSEASGFAALLALPSWGACSRTVVAVARCDRAGLDLHERAVVPRVGDAHDDAETRDGPGGAFDDRVELGRERRHAVPFPSCSCLPSLCGFSSFPGFSALGFGEPFELDEHVRSDLRGRDRPVQAHEPIVAGGSRFQDHAPATCSGTIGLSGGGRRGDGGDAELGAGLTVRPREA